MWGLSFGVILLLAALEMLDLASKRIASHAAISAAPSRRAVLDPRHRPGCLCPSEVPGSAPYDLRDLHRPELPTRAFPAARLARNFKSGFRFRRLNPVQDPVFPHAGAPDMLGNLV